MNLPSGLVFYMDFKYGTTVNGKTSGTSLYGNALSTPFGGFGNTDTGGLYGAGQFAYSVNDATLTGLTTAPASASFSDVNFNADYVATGSLSKYSIATSSFTNLDKLAVRSFIPSGSGIDFAAQVLPEFTKIVGANVVFIPGVTCKVLAVTPIPLASAELNERVSCPLLREFPRPTSRRYDLRFHKPARAQMDCHARNCLDQT